MKLEGNAKRGAQTDTSRDEIEKKVLKDQEILRNLLTPQLMNP